MKNTIEDLRAHLFDTLAALRDKDKPMDIDRARAISEVGQTIINSAKVEVEHMKLVGGKGTGFIQQGALTPGSANAASSPFRLGESLADTDSERYGDSSPQH